MKFLTFLFISIMTNVILAQEKPVLVVSSGHHQTLFCVDISSDGKYVASGGSDNLVKIYDMGMQQELNTFTGHANKVVHVDFTPDGKYIVSASQKEILVHSHPVGELIQRIDISLLSGDFYYQVTSDMRLYFGDDDDGIRVYNALTGELEKVLTGIKAEKFVILPDENTLIATSYHSGEEGLVAGVTYYSISENKQIDFIPIEGMLSQKYTASLDGKKLVFEVKMGEVAIFDTQLKKIESRLETGIGVLNIMKISPDGKQLVTSTFDNYVRFWDLNTGKKLRDIQDISPSPGPISMALAIMEMDFSDDGEMAVFCYQDLGNGKNSYTVEWFKTKTMESIGKHEGDVKLALSLSIDNSGKILSTGTINHAMGIKCLDLSKGNQKAFIKGSPYHAVGGDYLAAVNGDNPGHPRLEIYKMPAIRMVQSFEMFSYGNVSMSPSGLYVSSIDQKYTANSDPAKALVEPIVRVWNTSTGKEVVHLKKDLMDMPNSYQFTKDEKQILLLYSKRIEMVDLVTGKLTKTIVAELDLSYGNDISPDGKYIVASNNESIHGVDIMTGEKKELLPMERLTLPISVCFSPNDELIAISCMRLGMDAPNRILVYEWATKTLICELIGHTALVRQLTFGPKDKHVYSVDDNGIIAMWDISKCKAKASFLAFGEEDYLIISPDGYYKASKGNIASIGFRQKGALYTFDQFDLRYNRPDKVLESIGLAGEEQIEMYTKAFNKRLQRMGFNQDTFSDEVHAPDIEILESEKLPLNTASGSIEIAIKASDELIALDRLNVLVNGIPIYGKLGMSLKSANKNSHEGKLKIPLVNGVNLIQISVMNTDGIESVRKTYSIDCKKPAVKPDLYILAFGVRSYVDSSMNLTYSDKDAQDLVDLFQKNSGASGHYGKVHVQLLTNDGVKKEKVAESRAPLENSRVDDQVILFYSGHGLLDSQMDYFLSTHDVDFENPSERGLPFEDFRNLIDGIGARNRLILVDACHSGEVDKDEVKHADENVLADASLVSKEFVAKGKKVIGLGNSFELMKELFVELRKESGATIIASSAGKEFSLESKEWQNGVFTFVLKEALLERKAESNDDKKISVSELKSYLFKRVKELTNGKQTPTVRRENTQHDFVIY